MLDHSLSNELWVMLQNKNSQEQKQHVQVLLRVGIVRSRKAPTSLHPYGYLKDKFVWSLVSAVGIFCLGAGITTAHGFSSLLAGPQALDNLGYGISGVSPTFGWWASQTMLTFGMDGVYKIEVVIIVLIREDWSSMNRGEQWTCVFAVLRLLRDIKLASKRVW